MSFRTAEGRVVADVCGMKTSFFFLAAHAGNGSSRQAMVRLSSMEMNRAIGFAFFVSYVDIE